jgi:hypothetical protein
VPNVEHIHSFPNIVDLENDAINVRLAAKKQVTESGIFRRNRTTTWHSPQRENCFPERNVPRFRRGRIAEVLFIEQNRAVSFRPGGQTNEIRHVLLRTL